MNLKAKAKELMEILKKKQRPPSMKLYDDPPLEKILWKVRESGLGATARFQMKKIHGPVGKIRLFLQKNWGLSQRIT